MSNRYLPLFVSQVRLGLLRVTKIAVERDIGARRHEANIGKLFAYQREHIPTRDHQAGHRPDCDYRVLNNPLGRNGTSGGRSIPRRHDGDHSATMSLELA